ncbi:MAG: DUF4347 domain-containing protein, partial [Gemmataceae bacterium]
MSPPPLVWDDLNEFWCKHAQVGRPSSPSEIAILDASTPDVLGLANEFSTKHPDTYFVFLDPTRDGVSQITAALNGLHDVRTIHLFSHGADGALLLGNGWLDLADMDDYSADLSEWRKALAPGVDFFVYGCNVAEDEKGRAFVDQLALTLHADVAASSNLTGSSQLGGDWTLEYRVGSIDGGNAFRSEQWAGLLAFETSGLWISSKTSATTSAGSGGVTYNDGQVVRFTGSNLALGTGATSGTFSQVFDIDAFASDGNADVNGMHFVNQTVVVGSTTTATLQYGDVLFTVSSNETLGGVSVTTKDVILFRPTTLGNYSAGTFSVLLRDPGGTGNNLKDIALVEQGVTVGGASLQAGDFVLTLSSLSYDKDIQLYRPTSVGATTTSGTMSVLIDGNGSTGIGFGQQIWGLDVVSQNMTVGGVNLVAGQLLVSMGGNDTVGTNALSVTPYDIFVLSVTATGNTTSSGSATMLFRGNDVALSAWGEEHDAVALIVGNRAPTLDASKSPVFASINEDAGSPSGAVGTLVSSLVDFATPAGQVDNVTDPDSGALLGIAVTAADATNGSWWYSTDGGSNWNALGSVSNSSARLLAADAFTRLYFKPNADYNGVLNNAITFRSWDRFTGTNGALADTSTTGGVTAFSTATDTASLTINAVNDAP